MSAARDSRPRVLVVDDGVAYARAVKRRMPEFELVEPPSAEDGRFADGPSALTYLKRHGRSVDVVLLDMNFELPAERLLPLEGEQSVRRTRRFQGVAILRELRKRAPELPVVLLTAERDLSLVDADGELASQSMTYVLDGDDLDTLRIRIHRAIRDSRRALEDGGVLWGQSASMAHLQRRLSVLARGAMPVILEGETGTGKSFLAERFVHENTGRSGPFVVLDLSTIPSDLVAAHLFGAVRGAYTGAVTDQKGVFEAANGGTLFIDEIQNVPLEVQKQLLLVLQDRRVRRLGSTREIPVDVKVLAASNRPLQDAVAAGRFRPDLYMRLSPATRVRVPALRERPEDLRYLAGRFVEGAGADAEPSTLRARIARAVGLDPAAPLRLTVGRMRGAPDALELVLPEPAWQRLERHDWPGNLRELSMVMQNLVSFTLVGAVDALDSGIELRSKRLQVDPALVADLLQGSARLGAAAGADDETDDGGRIPVSVEPARSLNAVAQEVERQYLEALFRRSDGDLGRMALSLLGDESRTRAVRLRMNQLGLKVRELRGR